MNLYSRAVQQIINAQYTVIGPLALEQAKKVKGLRIDSSSSVTITDKTTKQKVILEELVKAYAEFFGQASIEVCKDAIHELKPPIPDEELPRILRTSMS
ncbi:hypothetical protein A3B56_02070 [Candidatus Roizmanbacteria bacterium RIFCSPLOWO2_01_FULL_45_11]|uniref:Uncharacterized protein n=1 Tax=Candidatus Roizmanbacteria bacterium RIFCSPLOWO2_01_FULL_45_11 TaxID=1802070 RepID=A0A1F7JE74_9BACT|nr:MAG: hypothetical protein A3B56_02070 [Candidatus Roizmanbacteria bacterium RIFCSPLOWO2_01_FULL_45_11]